jgi:hypothetical protein
MADLLRYFSEHAPVQSARNSPTNYYSPPGQPGGVVCDLDPRDACNRVSVVAGQGHTRARQVPGSRSEGKWFVHNRTAWNLVAV